jgi:mono/diheme cytochrome c family protein
MSQTDLEITHRIQDGNEPLMPAYRDKLTQPQMLALTVYVRAFAISPTEPAPSKPPRQPVAAQMSPVQVYRAYCLACHDADGRGQTARKAMPELPDFTDQKWQAAHTDAEFKQSILNGKGKFMMPMKDKLSPTDAEQMTTYVRAFRSGKEVVKVEPLEPIVPPPPTKPVVVEPPKKKAVPPVAAETAERMRVATGLYRQYCLVCHGVDGKGRDMRTGMPAIPDFASQSWQSANSNPQIVVGILDGKGTLMPAFRGRVSEDQALDLAAYLRAFGPAPPAAVEAPAGDFEQRFRELQGQWNELQKQLQDLSKRPRENK